VERIERLMKSLEKGLEQEGKKEAEEKANKQRCEVPAVKKYM
jgi:hypothetical protein